MLYLQFKKTIILKLIHPRLYNNHQNHTRSKISNNIPIQFFFSFQL